MENVMMQLQMFVAVGCLLVLGFVIPLAFFGSQECPNLGTMDGMGLAILESTMTAVGSSLSSPSVLPGIP